MGGICHAARSYHGTPHGQLHRLRVAQAPWAAPGGPWDDMTASRTDRIRPIRGQFLPETLMPREASDRRPQNFATPGRERHMPRARGACNGKSLARNGQGSEAYWPAAGPYNSGLGGHCHGPPRPPADEYKPGTRPPSPRPNASDGIGRFVSGCARNVPC